MEPTQRTLDTLREATTATISTQLFARGLRNLFLFGLRPLNAQDCSFVAEAFTLRYIPAREDLDVLDAFRDPGHPQRRAIESVGPGQVLVMDCRNEARAASAGHILTTRLALCGAAALVTDGSVRDSPEIARMAFPVFTSGISANTNLIQHHAVDLQVPIGCAGVAVFPGDILVGDAEGVVVIPRELAAEIAEPAAEQEELERFILERVRAGAALPGTYPPDAATIAAYRESFSARDQHGPGSRNDQMPRQTTAAQPGTEAPEEGMQP